jgi:hypothetical protein
MFCNQTDTVKPRQALPIQMSTELRFCGCEVLGCMIELQLATSDLPSGHSTANAMLPLLWAGDSASAQTYTTRRTHRVEDGYIKATLRKCESA